MTHVIDMERSWEDEDVTLSFVTITKLKAKTPKRNNRNRRNFQNGNLGCVGQDPN